MPRILAIDWDRREVRALLLTSGATGSAVAGAWAASLEAGESAGLSGKQIGARLAAAIGDRLGGKITTLVGVGRDHVQMQLLTLPPAPADELPELVRFQAEREFTTLGSDAALDFIPITGDAQTPHRVLAVALSPAGMAEARELCEALGVELSRIPLRACAAGALVRRAGVVKAGQVALIVNPLFDEADLAVQLDEKVVLMRTVRLPDPAQADARRRALVGEIRRTMAAVRQQLADRKVDEVVVCGSSAMAESIAALADELDVPVTPFDPQHQAPAGWTSQGVSADSLGRFTAVLGMALAEADRRPPIVDFANVRRAVAARRFSRTHVLAAAAVVLVALLFVANTWRQRAEQRRELAELESRTEQVEAQAELFKDATAHAAAVERWLATDVNWLDELEEFARRVRPQPLSASDFPVNDDVVVTQITMLRPPEIGAAGGRIDVHAKAKSDEAVRNLEHRLRDERRRVTPFGITRDNTVPGYPLATDLHVHVAAPNLDDDDAEPAAEGTP